MTHQMTLEQAASAFVQQHREYNTAYGLFKGNGIVPYNQQTSFEVDERIPLSPELEYWYNHYEMVDPQAVGTLRLQHAAVLIGDGILLSFAAPAHLHRLQLGHRWIGDAEMPSESEDWKPEHVVIASYNDDPIIADTSAKGTPIYVSFEGGDAVLAAPSLAAFFVALTILIEAATALSGEIQDEDTYEVKAEYMDHIVPKLNALLGEQATHHLLVYLSLQW